MKKFTRIEPTIAQEVGQRFKRKVIIKKYHTEDGVNHEFTTYGDEGIHGAAVIALTPDKKVVTLYQFRAGPERWMYELPGGIVEHAEDPATGARRELIEETGYTPGHFEFLGSSYGDAYTNFKRHYYLALDCVPGPVRMDHEEMEQGAEVRLISISELLHNATHDAMTDQVAVLLAYEKLKGMED